MVRKRPPDPRYFSLFRQPTDILDPPCSRSSSLVQQEKALKMPWQSAPPLAIITVAMGAVSGLMSLTNYLTVGRTDRLIGLDDFDYM